MANGLPAFQLQVVIEEDTNDWLDFVYGAATHEVQIPAATYDNMRAVAAALVVVMDAADVPGAPHIVSTGTDGKITITPTPATAIFSLLWKTGTHGSDNADTHCGDLLGFSDAADDTGAFFYTSDYQHQLGWYSDHGLPFDSRDRARVMGPATYTAVSDKSTRTTFATHYARRIDIAWITAAKFYPAFSALNEDFTTWWILAAKGTPFTYYSSTDTWVEEGNYVTPQTENEDLLDQVPRRSPAEELYSLTLRMNKQT